MTPLNSHLPLTNHVFCGYRSFQVFKIYINALWSHISFLELSYIFSYPLIFFLKILLVTGTTTVILFLPYIQCAICIYILGVLYVYTYIYMSVSVSVSVYLYLSCMYVHFQSHRKKNFLRREWPTGSRAAKVANKIEI